MKEVLVITLLAADQIEKKVSFWVQVVPEPVEGVAKASRFHRDVKGPSHDLGEEINLFAEYLASWTDRGGAQGLPGTPPGTAAGWVAFPRSRDLGIPGSWGRRGGSLTFFNFFKIFKFFKSFSKDFHRKSLKFL